MKKLLFFAAAVFVAGALGWLPATQKDVGGLLPARALILSQENGRLVLDGGDGLHGTGQSWEEAMADLCASAPGDAFFGAAGQIILVGDAESALLDVLADRQLRPAAQVYRGEGRPEADEAAKFLDAHKDGVTIQKLQAAALEGGALELPLLTCEDGRYHLENG